MPARVEKGMPEILEAAHAFLLAGYSVLPTKKGTKAPLLPSWKRLQKTPMTKEDASRHFRGDTQLGVICGAVSGNLEILDFDDPDAFGPFLELLELRAPGLAGKLVRHETPSGGYHLLYRSSESVAGNLVFAYMPRGEKTRTGKDVRIESRGEGGYTLVPPSEGYKVLSGSFLSCPVLTVTEVELIHTTARIFDHREPQQIPPQIQGRDNTEAPGTRYNAAHDIRDILSAHDWRPAGRTTAGEGWTRPGKAKGVSGVLLASTGNFYVWTSSVPELEPGKSYSAFALYTAYEHNGDYSKAARELKRQEKPGSVSAVPRAVAHEEGAPVRRFKLVRAGDVEAKPPQWLVRGLLERDALALVFGDPGCGKSFWALDLALCVSTGTSHHGNAVEQGPVVYIAGEGQNGIKRRLMAWTEARGISHEEVPLYLSLVPAAMTDTEEAEHMLNAIDELASDTGTPVLVVIDTLARNFGPADENSTKDMGLFIQAADKIRSRYQATVLLVHHSGHSDKTRARGAMALKGALDAEYRMDRDEEGTIRLEATKMKEAEHPEPIAFRLRSVDLPLADPETGEVCTSAFLDLTTYEPPARKGTRGRGKHQTRALEILGDLWTAKQQGDSEVCRLTTDEWKTAMREEGLPRQRIPEVVRSLIEAGAVHEAHGFITPVF